MSNLPVNRREQCDELLVQFALHGLEATDQLEMDELLREFEISEHDRFEQPVGALDAGLNANLTELFDNRIRQRIIDEAQRHVGVVESIREEINSNDSLLEDSAGTGIDAKKSTLSERWSQREKWMALVIAASLLLAMASIGGLLPRLSLQSASSTGPEQPDDSVKDAPLTAKQRLLALRSSGVSDLIVCQWNNPNEDAAAINASGEVVWSDSLQEGYMVIKNLEPNDPSENQYQLWIFDSARNPKHPVDGGVFDIAVAGEVVVPIDAKLGVANATMFGITIEVPGGVVVSTRERLPLLAVVNEAIPAP